MEKTVFFLDYANIDRAAFENGIKLNYRHLRSYIGEGRFLIESFCYVPIDPRNEYQMNNRIRDLWQDGYYVTKKIGTMTDESYKCNFDVEMTIDILRTAHVIKPDIIVIGTGDSDFLPVVLELRKMGIRTEIASFECSLSSKLLLMGSDYIDLSIYHEQLNPPSVETVEITDATIETPETEDHQ